jgi:hypothetical protein
LPFTTCLFQESYAFFLGAIEEIYNKHPPLSISLKEFPFTSHLVPVILYCEVHYPTASAWIQNCDRCTFSCLFPGYNQGNLQSWSSPFHPLKKKLALPSWVTCNAIENLSI